MIFCVEDDSAARDLMTYALSASGFEAQGFADGKSFFKALSTCKPSLIILDIMLPEEDGISILKKLRAKTIWADIPVIIASAKGTEYDKVIGLDMGADDYMTKPFAIEELLARIRVNLKKHRADRLQATGARCAGKLYIEPASYSVRYDQTPVTLTKKEFDLLNYLWLHEGVAVTRDELLNDVWGYEFTGDTNIVDVYIRYLRQKIDDRFGIKTIHTIRAVGYMFRYE